MIALLMVILLIATGLCAWKGYDDFRRDRQGDDCYEAVCGWSVAAFFLGCATFGFCVALFVLIGNLVSLDVVDDKIALYESRNAEINSALADMVENYMAYESETYKALKLDDMDVAIAIQAYPELTAQPLVQQQIDTFTQNQNEIVKLKENKLSRKVTQWWISFGLFGGENGNQ